MLQLKEIVGLKISAWDYLPNRLKNSPVSSTAYIKDKAPTDYNYAITSSAGTEGDAVTEGGEITFTISRSKVTNSDADSESTVYLNTKSGVATSEDYSSISNEKVVFKAFQNSHKVTSIQKTLLMKKGRF